MIFLARSSTRLTFCVFNTHIEIRAYLSGIAENDRLIDLELGKERIQTMDFLFLGDKCVVLGDALKRQLLHQIDLARALHVLLHEHLIKQKLTCSLKLKNKNLQ